METGRIWQRGASKGRKGSTNRLAMEKQDSASKASHKEQQDGLNDFGDDQDSMMSALQKSLIAETLSNARAHVGGKASLNEPSRPFTPGDMPRHLLYGNDYNNRPGSSYKMNNVIGQAADEFASANKTQANTDSSTYQGSEDVQSIMSKYNLQQMPRIGGGLPPAGANKPPMRNIMAGKILPSIDPNEFNKQKSVRKSSKATLAGNTQNILKIQQDSEDESSATLPKKSAGGPIKVTHPTPSMLDFQDLIDNDQGKKKQATEAMQQSLKDFAKIQEMIQTPSQKQSSTKKGQQEDFDYEDELQDEFAKSLLAEADQMGIFEAQNQTDQYSEALKKIEVELKKQKDKDPNQIDSSTKKFQKVKKEGEDSENEELYNQVIDDEGNLINESALKVSPYEQEYNEVISLMSKICSAIVWNNNPANKERKMKIDENELIELAPRIWSLSAEYNQQSAEDKQKCILQTVMKGSFSLLGIKSPKCALKISSCNIQLFFKILDLVIEKNDDKFAQDIDFGKVFNYLFETVRGLLIYAKEGEFDKLFIEENLVGQLAQVILKCYCEHADIIIKLTSQTVNNKLIANDDKMYDLINYVIGTIKCFTQTSKEVQKNTVQNQMIAVLSKALARTFVFGNNQNKQSMILVQISGTLRNLANVEDSYGLLIHCKVLPQLCQIYGDTRFKGHKELILNVSRLLSKVSIDFNCAEQMVQTKNTAIFLDTMQSYKENSAVLIRIAFVLGNLTTHYEGARKELCCAEDCFVKVIGLAQFYLEKDIQGVSKIKEVADSKAKSKKYEEFNAGNIEDAITKIVKLVANLSTEETYAGQKLVQADSIQMVQQFVSMLVKAIDKRTIDNNEEFILNAISCITNVLFYDIPSKELLNDDIRISIFNSIKLYILATQNEEIQIETVRVLSNLSRHQALCNEYVTDPTFLEALTVVLDHTLRDLVFYSVGIIINITLHPDSRKKILEKQIIVPKLVDVLRDSNIEDIDLSKVAAKALHNLTQVASNEEKSKLNDYWTNDSIKRLEEVLENLGDELDQIMDVASSAELEEIQSLRKLTNALNNDMPEPVICCPFEGCGRKFKNQEELELHIQRRHKK